MSFEEWAYLQQELFRLHPPRSQDQLGMTWTYYGGPKDGERETMHPAMNSAIERQGYRYACEFETGRLRCVGPV